MRNTQESTGRTASPGDEVRFSALFAQLVMQQANMAMMLLGKVSHPETGAVAKDLEAAQLFIDELEMLEVKTRGNLSTEEAGLLKQSLMSLRLAFVEAVETPAAESEAAKTSPPQAAATSSRRAGCTTARSTAQGIYTFPSTRGLDLGGTVLLIGRAYQSGWSADGLAAAALRLRGYASIDVEAVIGGELPC